MSYQKEAEQSLSEIQTSWHKLKAKTRAWWDKQRAEGNNTGYGHPDELAEHVVFSIKDFVVNLAKPLDKEKRTLEMKRLISQGRYEEVIDRGQQYYAQEYLPKKRKDSPFLIEKIISSLA